MKKPPIKAPAGADPRDVLAYLEQQAEIQESWVETYAHLARNTRATIEQMRRQLGGQLPDHRARPLTGPGRYSAGKREKLIVYVTLALENHFRKAATFDELARELEDGGAYLGAGKKALTNCLLTWSAAKHKRRGKPPRLKKIGEKIGLAEWGEDRF